MTGFNLTQYGDPVYAGMSDLETILSGPLLAKQMSEGSGHFYYASPDAQGMIRRREFARYMYSLGLR
jgi:hypothetical protein